MRTKLPTPDEYGRRYNVAKIQDKVAAVMLDRLFQLAKFPLDVDDLYSRLFSEEQHAAINCLMSNPKTAMMVEKRTSFLVRNVQIKVSAYNEHAVRDVRVILQSARPMNTAFSLDYNHLSFEQQEEMLDWAARWMELMEQKLATARWITATSQLCPRIGQLYRVWPELVSFFDVEDQQRLKTAKVASRYPDVAVKNWYRPDGTKGGYELDPRCRPEAFADFNTWIAEGLMLTALEGDKRKHIAEVVMS